jgi:peptidoglycan/xylan/chitin deacetylase (PgdA/CDA1 family)
LTILNGRPMSADELRAAGAEGGLVDVGAHTVTHPRLSRLARAAQAAEIERSFAATAGRSSAAIRWASRTRTAIYAPESVEIVRRAGFAAACDSHPDLVWSTGDAYRMPRIVVGNESGETLLRRLHWEWLA